MSHDFKNLVNFFFEAAKLKLTPRSGWLNAGVRQPESVADHSCSSAFIAFVLAKFEGADPYKAAAIAALHEIPETRVHDIDGVGRRYIDKEVEIKAMEEQFGLLPKNIADDLRFLLEYGKDMTPEQIVARDADILELILQAKIYKESGYMNVQHWIDEAPDRLNTETAKKFAQEIINGNSYEWARNLKVLKR